MYLIDSNQGMMLISNKIDSNITRLEKLEDYKIVFSS